MSAPPPPYSVNGPPPMANAPYPPQQQPYAPPPQQPYAPPQQGAMPPKPGMDNPQQQQPPQYAQQQQGSYPPPQQPYPPQGQGPPQTYQQGPPPPMGQPQQPGYGSSTTTTVITQQPLITQAIISFGEYPVAMTCPSCKAQIVTSVMFEAGGFAWLIFCLLFWFACWPCSCIPFCTDSCKDALHSCPNCRVHLGSYKRL